MYPYDVAKAKALLAAAGYADGFTMPMLVYNLQPNEDTFAQAVASQLASIGVKVNIVQPANMSEYITDITSLKYGVGFFEYGAQPMTATASQVLYPKAGVLNPFGSSDAKTLSLLAKLAAGSSTDYIKLSQQVAKRVLDIAWFAPLTAVDEIIYTRPELKGVILKAGELSPWPLSWTKK